MKATRTLLVASLISLALFANAQRHHHRHNHYPAVPNNAAQLTTMQSDLKAAIASMKTSLPIYSGYQTKAIHSATEALGLVNAVISGTSTSTTITNPASVDPNQTVGSKKKHTYSASQITASQTSLKSAMSSLQDAGSAYQSAMSLQTSSKRSRHLASLIRKAMSDATKAYNMHTKS